MAISRKWTKALTSTAAPADQFTARRGNIHAYVQGTFVATAALERSYDAGTTWVPVELTPNTPYARTAPGSVIFYEPLDQDVLYRWKLSAFTSGTANVGLLQGEDNRNY